MLLGDIRGLRIVQNHRLGAIVPRQSRNSSRKIDSEKGEKG